jgi:hypothetical protein
MRVLIVSVFVFAFNSCRPKQEIKTFGIPVDTSLYVTTPISDVKDLVSIPRGFKTEYLKPLLDPDPFIIADISVEDSAEWRLHSVVYMFKEVETDYFSLGVRRREFFRYALAGLRGEVKTLVDSCSYERDGYVFLYRNIKTTDTTQDRSIYQASIVFSKKPYVFISNFSFRNYTASIDTLIKQYAWVNARNWSLLM